MAIILKTEGQAYYMEPNRQNHKNEEKYSVDGYIGTYYSEKSKGIYHFTFDPESGRLTEPELFYEAPNAKWVSLQGCSMVFPIEKQGRAGTCFLEVRDGLPVRAEVILEEEQTPCYILQEGHWVYTANYHEGNIMIYRLENGRPDLLERIENGTKAGCHQVMLHENYLMAPCLEQHRIRLFDTGNGFAPAGEIRFPEGSGPRHGVFNRDHTKLYVVSEWSNELFIFQVHDGEFILMQTMSVLPGRRDEGGKEAAAAIRLAGDERFLYISVRGSDTLTVVDADGDQAAVIQHISCGGAHPRDMVFSGDGRFLMVANRFGGGIVSMERNCNNGLLTNRRHSVSMPEGVSLALIQHCINS